MKAGAPCKLTPEVFKIIVNASRKGLPWRYIAGLAGIDEVTLIDWRKKGEEATEGIFFELSQSLKKNRAEWVAEKMVRIDKAGKNGVWTADMTQLERFDQENFGIRTKHEITGEKGDPIKLKIILEKE